MELVKTLTCPIVCREHWNRALQKTKLAAEELAEMIRDGLAEEGHEVQVYPNPETGSRAAIISANNAEDAGKRAEAIASGLRQSYDLESNLDEGGYPPRFISREQVGRRAPARLVFEKT